MSRSVLQVINLNDPSPSVITTAKDLLEAGELIVAPTETRYGLLARGDNDSALDKLYSAKGRPKGMPTAVFLKNSVKISEVAEVSASGKKLIDAFLPGPMTLVLQNISSFKAPVVTNQKIGIRISSAPFIEALLEQVDFPVTATSANLSGQDEIEDASTAARIFGSKVALYVDGGKLIGEVSTVVDASVTPPEILREGAIKGSAIMKVINT